MIYGDLQDKMMQACEATSAPVKTAAAVVFDHSRTPGF